MDGGAWWAAVHGVTNSWTRLSDFTFTFHFHALEKEMATHSSILAWRIPGTGEPGGPPSMGSHRVGHDWSDSAAAAAAIIITFCRISVVARWLRIRLPVQGTQVPSLVQADLTCRRAAKPVHPATDAQAPGAHALQQKRLWWEPTHHN